MEIGEGVPKAQDRNTTRDVRLRIPVAEHFAKGLLSHYDSRAQLAGKIDSGELDMESGAGDRITDLLSQIDNAKKEGRPNLTLRISPQDLSSAREGFREMMTLGPVRGRVEGLLERELLDEVNGSLLLRIAEKARAFFKR